MEKQVKEQNKEKLQNIPKNTGKKRVPTKVKNPMGTAFDGLKTEVAPIKNAKKSVKLSKQRGDSAGAADKETSNPRAKKVKKTQDKLALPNEQPPKSKRIASPKNSNKNFQPILVDQAAGLPMVETTDKQGAKPKKEKRKSAILKKQKR